MSNCPARAGFTPPTQPTKDNRQDHPRSRGVYGPPSTRDSATDGSSPLARGLLAGVLDRFLGARIIPARAGFTCTSRRQTSSAGDHPRSRGVYGKSVIGSVENGGSSPLARGLPKRLERSGFGYGIIPARAGFTLLCASATTRPRDHPRSRGVYAAVMDEARATPGSSPLARGLRVQAADRHRQPGIIPARAGFTAPPRQHRQPFADHPRSRGVYTPYIVPCAAHWGSSPLARGLRLADDSCGGHSGIIPARAGFTGRCCGLSPAVVDHPRSRGVYPRLVTQPWNRRGSSPLARGLLGGPGEHGAGAGIIPARAGFTRWSAI